MMRLVARGAQARWHAPAAVLAAVVATLAVTAGPIRAAGVSPLTAYHRFLIQPLRSAYSIQEVLLAATPLLLTGLAVAIAFRAGYFNIGAEGQFLAGAMGATVPGLYADGLPALAALPLALGCGLAGGAAWALLPAWLKRTAGIDEVVTTLLLNPVALLLVQGLLNGPWRHPISGFPDSATFGPGYALPTVFGSGRVHAGLLIAVGAIVAGGIVMAATPLGLRLRAAGEAPDAARASGIAVDRLRWRAALLSGAVAGLAGAVQVLGVQHHLTGSIGGVGYGYTGIVVATLGALSAAGVLLVGLLLGLIAVGAQNASLVLQIPFQVGSLATAVLLLAVVAALDLRRYRLARGQPGAQRAPASVPETTDAVDRRASGGSRRAGLRGRGTR